jgi:hypothetical protein
LCQKIPRGDHSFPSEYTTHLCLPPRPNFFSACLPVHMLADLPEHVLEHVLQLCQPQDAVHVSAVSRAIRTAARSEVLWRHFYLRQWPQQAKRGAPAEGWRAAYAARIAHMCTLCEDDDAQPAPNKRPFAEAACERERFEYLCGTCHRHATSQERVYEI